MFNEGNQIHNFMSSSVSGTVINYGSGSDFLSSYGSVSGSGFGSGSTTLVSSTVCFSGLWIFSHFYPANLGVRSNFYIGTGTALLLRS